MRRKGAHGLTQTMTTKDAGTVAAKKCTWAMELMPTSSAEADEVAGAVMDTKVAPALKDRVVTILMLVPTKVLMELELRRSATPTPSVDAMAEALAVAEAVAAAVCAVDPTLTFCAD